MKRSKYDPKVEHDIVKERIFNMLDPNKSEIDSVVTKKQRSTFSIKDKPDITLNSHSDKVEFAGSEKEETIIEVETSETINEGSVLKWKAFKGLCRTLYLIVPESSKAWVLELCLEGKIKAIIGTYSILADGSIGEINLGIK